MPPKVNEYMSTPVIAVNPTDSLAHVRKLMIRHDISCVLVVKSEQPVGLVTKRDFVKIAADRRLYTRPLEAILAREVMASRVPTLKPTDSIADAARQMLKENTHYAVVVDEEGVVGILSSTDLVRAYSERYRGEATVKDYYSKDVVTVNRTHTLHYIAEAIANSKHGRVIVVDGRRPVGIITETDLAFLEARRGRVEDKPYKKKLGRSPRGHVAMIRTYLVPIAEEIMTPNPITASLEEDLADAAATMIENDVGGLPVVDAEGDLTGILTRLEILRALSGM